MVLAAFLFASMGVCVKIASDFFLSGAGVTGAIGIVFILWRAVTLTKRDVWPLKTSVHAWRSLVSVASLGAPGSTPLRAAGHRHDVELHEQRVDRRLPGRRHAALKATCRHAPARLQGPAVV